MAYTQITYRWPEGGEVTIVVGTDGPDRGYPDQMCETKACALALYRDIVGVEPAASEADPES